MTHTSPALHIRPGCIDDVPAILDLLDGAVAWMNARGNTQQWGTTPYSQKPGGVERVERYTTEHEAYVAELDGALVGAVVLGTEPGPQVEIAPITEPERYVRLLITDRQRVGQGIGSVLLAHAVEVTRKAEVDLLRVDCWAGGGGELVAYYERNGFVRTEPFVVGEWPGQVLEMRVG
ncbi:GCN5 family N-acetyltransferase [Streptomyces spiroverticillatus]|uniref:GCN5 family N-acetyltransferase n=1 Tax=Streptomyces finlayi TaxID=67296 RepID=A0A918WWA9_9ACTN|nr:GNAT family N-acetyltransferase [Streptomyces finlayi]GHA07174.1 GCN5 family N-acetyltransferase [Streptomyces spiroverticillatus]GHC90601.1 GCN5 family N-acetyltransferase [Streptomyces finlayi]